MNRETYLHLHIGLSDSKYNAQRGRLTSAVISGTGEIIIEEIDGEIEREFNKEVRLNLLFKLKITGADRRSAPVIFKNNFLKDHSMTKSK